MRKPRLAIPWVYLVTLILLLSLSCKEKQTTAAAPPSSQNAGPPSTPVDAFVAGQQSVEQIISTTGNLIANESVQIRPEISGKVNKLFIREGAFVEGGQNLALLDDAELIAQRNKLNVGLKLAVREIERGEELLKVQGISSEEMDRLLNRKEDLEADLEIIEVRLAKTKICAPFSGVLGLREISEGAYITPSNVIIELNQVDPIKLEFDVPERFSLEVKEKQELKFTVDGLDKVFTAKVYAIGAEIAPTTRTFKVRATSSNKERLLKPGQFAKITLVTGIDRRAILIPTDAVIPVLDGKHVYIAKGGKAISRTVRTGERFAGDVQILEGLEVGDTVITSGLLSLSDGSPVRINQLQERNNQSAL